jgi:ABC-type spermidine/putrescine transport system permease subunit II
MSAGVVAGPSAEDIPLTPATDKPLRRRGFDRPRWLWVVTALTMLFLFVPIAVVLVYSFNTGRSLNTFTGAGLRWYRTLAHDSALLASLRLSLWVAVVSALAAVLLGTMLAFGVRRGARRVARITNGTIFLRLVTPETATGVALLLVFTKLGIELSTLTLVISHIAFSIAYVAVIVHSRLVSINSEVEDSAMDLGATQLRATWLVTVPLLWPAILAAGLLAFVLSFDDFVTSFFTSGAGTSPLPVRIYSMIKFGVTPEINAAGVLMLVVTAVAIALTALVTWALRRRRRWMA